MVEQLVPPGGHTALSDPKSVLLELVDETRERPGYSLAEAYAFLAGADANTSSLPPIVAAFNPRQRRADDGRWIKMGGVSDAELQRFDTDVKKAATGKKALRAAKSTRQLGKSDPVRLSAADYYMSGGYKSFNANLRGGGPLSHIDAVALDRFDSMHDESTLERDVVVTRGIRDPKKIFTLAWNEDGDNSGLEWRDDAIVSTSVDSEVAEWHSQLEGVDGAVIMTMLVPKGVGAIHMEHETADSRQLTLERSLWYRIVRDHGRDAKGVRRLDVSVSVGGELTAATKIIDDDVDVEWPTDREIDVAEVFIDNGPSVQLARRSSEIPLVAAAEVHTGAMIALVPSSADRGRLAVSHGEPISQLHTTLVYLGEADEISDDVRRAIVARLRSLVVDAPLAEFEAEGFSLNVFNPPGHVKADGKDRDACIVLGVGGAEIDRLHTLVANAVSRIDGLKLPEQHKPWVPHITLTYTDDVSQIQKLTDRVGPVSYTTLRIAFAGEIVDVPLVS